MNNADRSVNDVSWGGCAYSVRFSSKTLPDLRGAGCPLPCTPMVCGVLCSILAKSLSSSDQIISKASHKHIPPCWGSAGREGGDNAVVPQQPGGHPAVLPTLQEPSSSPTR